MPCMMNGKPVPGIKGQCPMGSTWSENNMVNLVRSQEDRITQDYSEEDKTAYKKEKAEGSMFSKMMDLINTDTQNQTKGNKELIKLMEKNGVLNPTPSSMMAASSDSGRRGKATLDPQHKSRHGGTFEPTKMQTLMKNMKNPEWWSESISGLPSDTRLMRLGQLMNYYGKTPKGRDASDDPSKLWAANEAAAQKNKAAVLAAGAKRADEIYGKKTIEDLTADVLPDVKEMFGDTFWGSISSNPNASDEAAMMSLASQVATNIKAITVAYPEMTPNEVRERALKELMEDKNLEKLN